MLFQRSARQAWLHYPGQEVGGSLLCGADLSAPRLVPGCRAPEKEMREVC
jgi:hypothetical protein